MRPILAAALLALIALPAHGAAPVLVIASSLTATGTVEARGDLAAATLYDSLNGTRQAADFTLTAPSLRVESDGAEAIYGAGANLAPRPTTQAATYTAATLSGLTNRAGFQLDLVADTGTTFQLETTCAHERASSSSAFDVERYAKPDRPPIQQTVASTVEARACADATLTVQGSFLVVLWAWDARLDAAEGTRTLRSGFIPSTEGPVAVGRVEQHFIQATDGRLTLPLAADAVQRILTPRHTLSLDGTAVLADATATAPGLGAVRGTLTLEGASRLDPKAEGDGLRIHATGDFRLLADGAAVYDSRAALPTPSGAYAAWAPWAIATGLLIALLWLLPAVAGFILAPRYAADWPSWRKACGFFWCSLSRLSPMARLRLASLAARRAYANHPGADALEALADAHHAEGRPGAEIDARERLELVLPTARAQAENALQAARAALRLDDPREALLWLIRANSHDRECLARNIADPAFKRVHEDLWVRLRLADARYRGYA